MGDFDNISSLEEYDEYVKVEERRKAFKLLYKILAVVFACLVGFLIYALLKFALDKGPNETEININSSDIRALYGYVTYGNNGVRNTKFVYNEMIDSNSFNNDEKFYYALQFASPNDFIYDENYNKKNNTGADRIYLLSDAKIKQYMHNFFGDNVIYSSNDYSGDYHFLYKVGKNNVGNMKYNPTQGAFDVVFKKYENDDFKPALKDYYTSLYQAVRLDDGAIKLREKVVYLSDEESGENKRTVFIYKDKGHQELLGQIPNVTEDVYNYGTIDFSTIPPSYYIEYTFGLNGVNYYFKSSQLIKE